MYMTAKAPYFFTLALLLATTIFAQQNPPPMALPKDSSIIIVDKIIEATKHEKYFTDYCTKKVKTYASENNWSSEKTIQTLESIRFKYYNSTIYNSYAFYSLDQLNILLEAITVFNENPKNNLTMILTNAMMQSNLDLFVDGVIKGKYVMVK